jgi:glycosyltransferase involved in cell wall biosynthesis
MSLLNVQPTTIVITIVARLDPQKRPMMVPRIVTSMLEKQAVDFIIVMVGDGDLGPSLSQEIGRLDVNEFVSLEGTSSFPRDYLVASDIFLLPSLSEGISIAVAEAMAMGLPVVTALAGALPEQLGYEATNVGAPLAGLLVNHTLVDGADAELYADALLSLINDPELRSKLGKRGRANVERTFQWRETLGELWGEVERGRNLKWEEGEGKGLPNPSTYYSLQGLQTEHPDLDFARQYQQDY